MAYWEHPFWIAAPARGVRALVEPHKPGSKSPVPPPGLGTVVGSIVPRGAARWLMNTAAAGSVSDTVAEREARRRVVEWARGSAVAADVIETFAAQWTEPARSDNARYSRLVVELRDGEVFVLAEVASTIGEPGRTERWRVLLDGDWHDALKDAQREAEVLKLTEPGSSVGRFIGMAARAAEDAPIEDAGEVDMELLEATRRALDWVPDQ